MAKLNRSSLKKLILKEIQKMMDEETLFSKNDYKGYGMLSKHDDPGRQSMYMSCSECGSKMYEGDSVCEQCGSMNEKSSCNEHGHMFENGSCSECGVMEEEATLHEGSCGSCGICETCNDGSDYSLDTMQIVGNALHALNDAGYNVDATKRKDYKIGNHKIYKGSYMAKSHLYKVAKYAEKLYHMIPDGHNLEDWMRSKLAQIADDIGEVYHAIDHDVYEGDI